MKVLSEELITKLIDNKGIFVTLAGKLSEKAFQVIKPGLSINTNRKTCFYLNRSNFDLPKETRFNYLLDLDNGEFEQADIEITSITQQFGKPWEEIPHGWGTICSLKYQNCRVLDSLEEYDQWPVQSKRLLLGTNEFYQIYQSYG